MVCVVGEFNVGKSTFINALFGAGYLEDGVTPTTSMVLIKLSSVKYFVSIRGATTKRTIFNLNHRF